MGKQREKAAPDRVQTPVTAGKHTPAEIASAKIRRSAGKTVVPTQCLKEQSWALLSKSNESKHVRTTRHVPTVQTSNG